MSTVCVVGGGPAGSTFASRMAGLGHDVWLIERQSFPRRHLGKSLGPGVLPLLEMTGARGPVEARARPVRRVDVKWEAAVEMREDPREQGAIVDRGEFDRLLLERACALGVRVLQPATVRTCEAGDGGWRLGVEAQGRSVRLDVDFLADARGRAGAAAGSRRRIARRTLALYAYWRGAGLPRQPRIEAAGEAWYWCRAASRRDLQHAGLRRCAALSRRTRARGDAGRKVPRSPAALRAHGRLPRR